MTLFNRGTKLGWAPRITLNTSRRKLWSPRWRDFPVHCMLRSPPNKIKATLKTVDLAMDPASIQVSQHRWVSLSKFETTNLSEHHSHQ